MQADNIASNGVVQVIEEVRFQNFQLFFIVIEGKYLSSFAVICAKVMKLSMILQVMIPPIFSINGMVNHNGNFSQLARAINLTGLDAVLEGSSDF